MTCGCERKDKGPRMSKKKWKLKPLRNRDWQITDHRTGLWSWRSNGRQNGIRSFHGHLCSLFDNFDNARQPSLKLIIEESHQRNFYDQRWSTPVTEKKKSPRFIYRFSSIITWENVTIIVDNRTDLWPTYGIHHFTHYHHIWARGTFFLQLRFCNAN